MPVSDPLGLALLAALLLGLRHATDPDHLTALLTLVADDADRASSPSRAALILGTAWGAGHAVTLLAFGLPVVLWGSHLPEWVHGAAELAVGLLIVGLAVRLLVRWRRGHFHGHRHAHGGVTHAHPHFHEADGQHAADGEEGVPAHGHRHASDLGRTPWGAFGVGLVHGVGGSAGASVLVTAAAEEATGRVAALSLFAFGTLISMAALTMLFGVAFAGRMRWRRAAALVPAVGIASLAFGLWYAWQAWGSLAL